MSQAVRGPARWGFGLSVALHTAVLLGLLLLVPQARMPEGTSGSVELVMLPAEPQQAPTAAPAAASPQPANAAESEIVAADSVPPPVPEQVPDTRQRSVLEQPTVPLQAATLQPPPVAQVPPAALVVAEAPAPTPPKSRPERASRPARPVPTSPPVRAPASRSQVAATSARTEPAGAPSASPAPVAPPRQGAVSEANPAWLAAVGAWLQAHRSYPQMARSLGQQGTVVIQITVNPDGYVADANLVRSSGTNTLDHAAEALLRNAHLPPFPAEMNLPRQSITIPIRYRLE